MLRVIDCVVNEHDWRLVAVAAAICLFSAIVAFQLYGRAQQSTGATRAGWVLLSGLALGVGTWATHFIAMLAYRPQIPTGYEPGTTIASLVIAIAVMSCGFLVALLGRGATWRLLAGGMIGAGIGAMHFTGMRAFLVPGHLAWDASYVLASLMIGVTLGSASLMLAGPRSRRLDLIRAAVVMTVAIAGLHFTAMAAATIQPDPAVLIPDRTSSGLLAAGVVAATLILLMVGAISMLIDHRSQTDGENRLRDLAEASVEGVVICSDGLITDANQSFCKLVGQTLDEVRGLAFEAFVTESTRERLSARATSAVEGDIGAAGAASIPVTIIARNLGAGSQGRTVYAVRDLREHQEAHRRIHFLAHHDPLTGLPNRVTFAEALKQALTRAERRGAMVGVLCLDLDRFKAANDSLGHAVGDEVLIAAGERIASCLREGDIVARLGGDEFAVLQVELEHPDGASALARRLVDTLSQPFHVAGHQVVIGTSVGIGLAPADGTSPEQLLRNADMALYRAKAEGRGTFRFFEPEMDAKMQARRKLEVDLRAALVKDELELFYQPLVNVRSGLVTGFEALLRWRHPERGLVSPAEFIPLAEEIGLIVPMGEWVIRQASKEAARWPGDLNVSVNLSAAQFKGSALGPVVLSALQASGLRPNRLELEITEGVLLQNNAEVLAVLHQLRAMGVRIAMDDFGTGYSSLSYLRSFPFDKIKIDQSFVRDLTTREDSIAIVRAVTDLGTRLGMSTTAEGVETAEQLSCLTDQGCTEVQGYLFSRPMPASEIPGILRKLGQVRAAA